MLCTVKEVVSCVALIRRTLCEDSEPIIAFLTRTHPQAGNTLHVLWRACVCVLGLFFISTLLLLGTSRHTSHASELLQMMWRFDISH